MKISARNQFEGTISNVVEVSEIAVVTIDFEGYAIKADITMESIKGLELAEGKKAFAIIKASNVMFAAGSEPIKNISARNQLVGIITSIKEGAVIGHVALELADGNKVIGSITNEAIESLGLAEGEKAVAIIKSTDVMVGVE